MNKYSEESSNKNDEEFYKTKEETLKQIFRGVFVGNQVISIEGRRKTGKSTLVMEIITQNLIRNPENQVLLLSSYGNFNIKKYYNICESYMEKDAKDTKNTLPDVMKRLKIIQMENESDFYDYFSCLEAMILGLPNLSFLVIDSISFYHNDSYIFQKIYGINKLLTREMYLNHFVGIFSHLVQQYGITILYTLPQHLVAEYGCSRDYENESDHFNVFEHIKLKTEPVSKFNYPTSVDDELDLIKAGETNEECDNNLKEAETIELMPSERDDQVQLNNPGISEVREEFASIETQDNKPSTQLMAFDSDSFSDTNSVKSGEGYKSESGTDQSSVVNEKVPEAILNSLYNRTIPDVTIKLSNESKFYSMLIKKDNEEFEVIFDINEKGIEYIHAEKQL